MTTPPRSKIVTKADVFKELLVAYRQSKEVVICEFGSAMQEKRLEIMDREIEEWRDAYKAAE